MVEKACSAARRKRQRKIVDEYCSFIVEIRDWELTYSHGLNSTPKLFPGQYSEHLQLCIKGLFHMPEKHSTKEEFNRGANINVKVSRAKAWIGEMVSRVAYHALQLHGGYGYCEEYRICGLYRDVRILSIFAGTTEIMKLIIARSLGLKGF
jgi:hypothetical protein